VPSVWSLEISLTNAFILFKLKKDSTYKQNNREEDILMKYYFFPEDIAVLEQTVNELKRKIRELGKEQGEAARQSTENFGHDDACQEAVYQARTIVIERLKNLREILNNAVIFNPEGPFSFDMVRMGATVELSNGRVLKIGSFMVFADYPIVNISYDSPLGKALLKKKEGDRIEFQGQFFTVKRIS